MSLGGFTLARRTGVTAFHFWPVRDFPAHLAWWLCVLLGAAAVTFLATRFLDRVPTKTIGRALTAAACGFILLATPRSAAPIVVPSYTMRDIARDLGQLLGGGPVVDAACSEGLFNGNGLPYRTLTRGRLTRREPEAIVAVRNECGGTVTVPDEAYCLIRTYELRVSEEYESKTWRGGNAVTEVWLRRSSGRCPVGGRAAEFLVSDILTAVRLAPRNGQ